MQLGFQMLEKGDGNIMIICNQDDDVRYVRITTGIRRLWYLRRWAIFFGHLEGDMLVIDTVGTHTDVFTSVGRLGTPQSVSWRCASTRQTLMGFLVTTDAFLNDLVGPGSPA
jgi:hypothetical protein